MVGKDVLHLIGLLSLLGYGLGSMFLPHRIAPFIAQRLDTPRGVAEFRVVNGGYFIGLSIFALVANQPLVFAALGAGWLGAAAARLLALILDRPKLDASYLGFLASEIVIGLFLLA